MRSLLTLALAALVAPATVRAAEPVSRVLDDLRAAADLVGGERAVKALNGSIREKFGEKGLTGLDAERPVFGYVSIAEKAEDIVAVVALPFTAEKEFLALYERAAGAAPKDLGKGVYEVFAEEKSKGLMRFSNRYAYIAIGAKPEGALDDKALVPANKVVDPAEPAIFTGKFHFDRLPPEVLKAVPRHIADFKKEIENNAGGLPIGQQELGVFKPLFEEMEKMVGRYTVLLAGTDTATLRVGLDVGSGDLSTEFALKGKPDSALSKAIAARKPTTNKFGALLTPDTVAGFKVRLPLFSDEVRTGIAKTLEEGQKLVPQNEPGKAAADELFKGLVRTVKAGEFDIVGGVRGPNKDGDFALVAAVAFEDGAALEKEFKKFVQAQAPQDEQERFKWDADKAGKVSIHTYKPSGGPGVFGEIGKPFGDGKALLAFAFAPNGVFVVLGPDPVPAVKAALAAQPADAPVLDVLVNPARMKKFVEKAEGQGADVERALGADDKLMSALSLGVTGGKELRVRFAINLRLLPRAAASGSAFDADKTEPKLDKK
jgi:hypothetical protein